MEPVQVNHEAWFPAFYYGRTWASVQAFQSELKRVAFITLREELMRSGISEEHVHGTEEVFRSYKSF